MAVICILGWQSSASATLTYFGLTQPVVGGEWKGREERERESKGWEGKGRESKGRESKGREIMIILKFAVICSLGWLETVGGHHIIDLIFATISGSILLRFALVQVLLFGSPNLRFISSSM